MERAQAGVTVADPSQPHIVRSDADDIDLRPELLLEIHELFEPIIARTGSAGDLVAGGFSQLFAPDINHPGTLWQRSVADSLA